MSSEAQSEPEGEPGVLRKAYYALSPEYESHPDAEMDSIGWSIFLILLVMLVPLLPVLVVGWVILKVLDALSPQSPSS